MNRERITCWHKLDMNTGDKLHRTPLIRIVSDWWVSPGTEYRSQSVRLVRLLVHLYLYLYIEFPLGINKVYINLSNPSLKCHQKLSSTIFCYGTIMLCVRQVRHSFCITATPFATSHKDKNKDQTHRCVYLT